jgi:ankyrin repeat domain-containing protein 13
VLKKFEKEVDHIVESSKPHIVNALKEMENFYVEIKWDFESWIPLISRFLPSDVCKLYKQGTKLRIDCTLGDIAKNATTGASSAGESASSSSTSPFSWQRGDLTFLFEVDKIGDKNSIVFLDNKRKTFIKIDKKPDKDNQEQHDLEKEIDLLLSKEMIYLKLNTRNANFLPTQTGWFSKRDKIEQINGYTSQFYDVSNLFIVSKLRTEHLSEEELKSREEKQLKLKEQLKKSKSSSSTNKEASKENKESDMNLEQMDGIDFDEEIQYRPSLEPPSKNTVTWNEYISAKEGEWPNIGRKTRCKESKKEFKAQLAMVNIN